MNATEARAIALEKSDIVNSHTYKEIKRWIEQAAKNGEFKCRVLTANLTGVSYHLKKEGFEFESCTERKESGSLMYPYEIYIKW